VSRRVDYHALLEQDVQAGHDWISPHSLRTANALVDAIRDQIGRIVDHPESYPEVRYGVRRAVVLKYRFLVFFQVTTDSILIVGAVHGTRDVERWLHERLHA
jgi:plasmid stabilization system protein ParE